MKEEPFQKIFTGGALQNLHQPSAPARFLPQWKESEINRLSILIGRAFLDDLEVSLQK